jgi:tetratricopeptide (TPR) repeat protein
MITRLYNYLTLCFLSIIFTIFGSLLYDMKYLILLLLFIPISILAQSNFETAESFFKSEKYNQAKLFFEKELKQNPDNLKTLEYLGDIQCYYKNWKLAIPYYKRLIELKPKEAQFYYKYGGALGMEAKESNKFKALGMISDIENAFLTATRLDKNHIDSRWALVMLYLELPAIIGGSEIKAQKYSDELMKISLVDGFLSKGYIDEYFRRYTAAEKNYLKAIEIGKSKNTYQKLANLYKNKMNQPEKAKQILNTYNEKSKS